MGESILSVVTNAKGVTYLTVAVIVTLVLVLFHTYAGVRYLELLNKLAQKLARLFGGSVARREQRYYRDITIGRINEKKTKVKAYRFLNDLIIDLGLKRKGATPYEFLFLVLIASAIVSILIGALLGHTILSILCFPIVTAGILCGLYTKANLAHDNRIDDVIEAENIISNNIKGGVMASVRTSLDVLPEGVRTEFRDFLDNVELKNFHVVTALLELNNNLGTIADDFIKKCIMFETEEEHGYSGVFKDVVEVNNIKTAIRNDVKRKFDVVVNQFRWSLLLIVVFMLGLLIIYPFIRELYFGSLGGNIILILDALLIVVEFVLITKYRATEL